VLLLLLLLLPLQIWLMRWAGCRRSCQHCSWMCG
jgi:hypothetical protein